VIIAFGLVEHPVSQWACLYCGAKVLLAVGIAQYAANVVRRGIIRGSVPLGGINWRHQENNGEPKQWPAKNKLSHSHDAEVYSFWGRINEVFCATISMVSRANIQHFLQVEKGRCRILMAFSISHCSNENGQRQDFLKFILLIFEKAEL